MQAGLDPMSGSHFIATDTLLMSVSQLRGVPGDPRANFD